MRFSLLVLLACVPFLLFSQNRKVKQANKETANWRYEIEPVGIATQGNSLLKVWSYSSDPNVALEQGKKNAIHGVIFKGIPNKDRLVGKKPLVSSPEVENQYQEFFKSFFADGGDYMRYVTLTNAGTIAAGDCIKLDKKEYKVGVIVTINYSELRATLEKNGIVKKLDSGF